MALIGNDIAFAKQQLQQGNLVAIPTETVYGLAANALDEKAVASIFTAKNRPTFDPLIVHTHCLENVYDFVTDIHPKLLQLASTFWPGPLTLLLPKKNCIPYLVTSGLDRVGVRVPHHTMTLQLLQLLDFPLAAPSANPFGYISPTTAQHVNQQLGAVIPYILDGGACSVGLESTIVGEENGIIIIHRLGGLSIEAIQSVIGEVEIQLNQSSNPVAPGQLKSHYAPKKPFVIRSNSGFTQHQQHQQHQQKGLLCFGNHSQSHLEEFKLVKNLSPNANYQEAAINLFAYLRELDEAEIDVIMCDFLPEENLGLAINDRLKRALH